MQCSSPPAKPLPKLRRAAAALAAILLNFCSPVAPRSILQLEGLQGLSSASAGLNVQKSFREKLQQVPVFMITNEAGQPFLTSSGPSQDQIGTLFLFPQDAQKVLDDMQRSPNMANARVFVTNLDIAYNMALRPQRSGLKGSDGSDLLMYMRFHAHSGPLTSAQMLLLKKGQKAPPIPCFVANRMQFKKNGELVTPAFLAKEDLEVAWQKLLEEDPSLPSKPDIEVVNLMQLLLTMDHRLPGEVPAGLKSMDLVPPSKAVSWMKQRARPGRARILTPNNPRHQDIQAIPPRK